MFNHVRNHASQSVDLGYAVPYTCKSLSDYRIFTLTQEAFLSCINPERSERKFSIDIIVKDIKNHIPKCDCLIEKNMFYSLIWRVPVWNSMLTNFLLHVYNHLTGFTRSWKSHGKSWNFKFFSWSGKIIEFREKSFRSCKSHGIQSFAKFIFRWLLINKFRKINEIVGHLT